jgi:hypothetical protein
MNGSTIARSPQPYARWCGALYLYVIVAGMFAELFVRSKLVVPGDAAETAANLLARETLFRLGVSGELLHIAFDALIAALLWALLRPVDRTLALAAAFTRLACDVVLAVASLSHFAALRLLRGGDWLPGLDEGARQSMALLALRLHGDAYSISLVFFAFTCLALGVLVARSGFLPKWIGVLLVVAGLCYLVNSFTHFLAPALAGRLFPALFVPIFVAEASLTLQLLIRGVDAEAWQSLARERGAELR